MLFLNQRKKTKRKKNKKQSALGIGLRERSLSYIGSLVWRQNVSCNNNTYPVPEKNN